MTRTGSEALPGTASFQDEPYWLSSSQLAAIAECTLQAAQKAILRATRGHSWNGAELVVRKQGRAHLVDARSLPEHLYSRFYDARRDSLTTIAAAQPKRTLHAEQRIANVDLLSKQFRTAKWQAEIIGAALEFERGTRGRGESLRALAAQVHVRPTDGKPIRFTEATLREFCARYERGGVHALMRKERKPETKARCRVNRRWDAACPLPAPVKALLAVDIESYIRGLWAAGAPSRSKVRLMASAQLAVNCRGAGWPEATPKNCDVGQYLVETNQDVRKVAVYHGDAKRFDDRFKPRVQRDRSSFAPGDAIVGDVHPVDVYLARPDGSTYTPRMIAWYDLATNRCFYTVVHCEPGRSVTQADVTRSFVELCTAWGIPRTLYLDNGPEYSWAAMVSGFEALAALGAELDCRRASKTTQRCALNFTQAL